MQLRYSQSTRELNAIPFSGKLSFIHQPITREYPRPVSLYKHTTQVKMKVIKSLTRA